MNKLWMFIKQYKFPILVAATPIIVNYFLFTWRAPGLVGNSSDWFTFLGSYLGFIGAVYIALFQMKKQEKLANQEKLSKARGYILFQDYTAPLRLIGLKSSRNARIILTSKYKELLKDYRNRESEFPRLKYIKIVLHGCELIYNSVLEYTVSLKALDGNILETRSFSINIGPLEKGVEPYVPLIADYDASLLLDNELQIDKLVFNYTTVEGEDLKYVRDYETEKETLIKIVNNEIIQIYSVDCKPVEWMYPENYNRD